MTLQGIIHCHSDYSYDAKLPLAELKRVCVERGVQFVCMTEHTDTLTPEVAQAFVAECDALSDDSFRFIPGFEVPYKHAHILMIGVREFKGTYAPTLDALREWSKDAPFVVLAHPVRNKFIVEDGLLAQLDALEIWNQQYEGKLVPRTRSIKLLQKLRTIKPTLLATGGIDFHRIEHFGTPFVMLDVAVFTEATILEKLKAGAYTVSSAHTHFFGTLPNDLVYAKEHRVRSAVSVSIIVLGKAVNALCARIGVKLPKGLKQQIRRHL